MAQETYTTAKSAFVSYNFPSNLSNDIQIYAEEFRNAALQIGVNAAGDEALLAEAEKLLLFLFHYRQLVTLQNAVPASTLLSQLLQAESARFAIAQLPKPEGSVRLGEFNAISTIENGLIVNIAFDFGSAKQDFSTSLQYNYTTASQVNTLALRVIETSVDARVAEGSDTVVNQALIVSSFVRSLNFFTQSRTDGSNTAQIVVNAQSVDYWAQRLPGATDPNNARFLEASEATNFLNIYTKKYDFESKLANSTTSLGDLVAASQDFLAISSALLSEQERAQATNVANLSNAVLAFTTQLAYPLQSINNFFNIAQDIVTLSMDINHVLTWWPAVNIARQIVLYIDHMTLLITLQNSTSPVPASSMLAPAHQAREALGYAVTASPQNSVLEQEGTAALMYQFYYQSAVTFETARDNADSPHSTILAAAIEMQSRSDALPASTYAAAQQELAAAAVVFYSSPEYTHSASFIALTAAKAAYATALAASETPTVLCASSEIVLDAAYAFKAAFPSEAAATLAVTAALAEIRKYFVTPAATPEVIAALGVAESKESATSGIDVSENPSISNDNPATNFTVEADGTTVDAQGNLIVGDQGPLSVIAVEIQTLADTLNGEDLAGLGTLDQYAVLLDKVAQLQNLSRTLSVTDLSNLDLLASQAASIDAAISAITRSMEYVSVVDDGPVLLAVKSFLTRIKAMVIAVQKFHIQIHVTATIKVPRSIEATAAALTRSKAQLLRVQGFLNHFTGVATLTDPGELAKASISATRAADITRAMTALDTVKALGDATLSGTVKSVQDLTAIANEIAQISFSQSLAKLELFKTAFAASASTSETITAFGGIAQIDPNVIV